MQQIYIRIYLFPTNYTSVLIYIHYYFSDMFQLIKIAILWETVYTKVHLIMKHSVVNCAR